MHIAEPYYTSRHRRPASGGELTSEVAHVWFHVSNLSSPGFAVTVGLVVWRRFDQISDCDSIEMHANSVLMPGKASACGKSPCMINRAFFIYLSRKLVSYEGSAPETEAESIAGIT